MVRAGLGVSMIPSLLLSPAGPSEGLAAVPMLLSISRTVRIGSRVGVQQHPIAEAFLQLVAEQGPVMATVRATVCPRLGILRSHHETVTGRSARRHSSMPSPSRCALRPRAVRSRTASWARTQ
jgi:hypothetical protein